MSIIKCYNTQQPRSLFCLEVLHVHYFPVWYLSMKKPVVDPSKMIVFFIESDNWTEIHTEENATTDTNSMVNTIDILSIVIRFV